MSANDLNKEKLQIIDWILKQDTPSVIKAVAEHINQMEKESTDSEKVVGYRPRGLRVTAKHLVESISLSLEELKRGEIISLDRLEQESDQW